MPKTLRSFFAYAYSSMSDFFTAARGSGGNGGGGGGGGGAHGGSSGTQSSDSSSDQQLACCCGVCRMTRCPRWFAILVALSICVGCLGIFVLVIADAIQRFQHESLNAFVDEAGALINRLQRWLAGFGISLEGAAILDALKQQINVPSLVKTTVTVIIDGIGNGVLILLLVLYLLAEQSSHVAGSLRARLDDQIQRYIGIKTVISLAQGLLVYIILGWFLGVRMAHLFGVVHFILNFIPTVSSR
jgi:predicted PurR-regulated permease PerM